MPYDVTILPESRVGLTEGSGHLTGHDLLAACGAMVRDALWTTGFDEVWDLTAAREVDVSPEELDRLVRATHDFADEIGENRVVFVTTRDSVSVLVRLFERLTADLPRTYHVARTRREAEAWLGLEAGALSTAAGAK